MTEPRRKALLTERALLWISLAALLAAVLANVIRVAISADAALMIRAVMFAGSWVAAAVWAALGRHTAVLVWLGSVAACGIAIAICQTFAGGVGAVSLLHVVGPAGAGIGVALLMKKCLETGPAAQTALIAGILGGAVAIWLALEPGLELWKLLPNDWEISKNLEYRWGIRMGEERARFLYDTPMEAGVVQWFLGAVCLAAAAKRSIRQVEKFSLCVIAVLLFATVALTYTRAGLALGALSLGFWVLLKVRKPRIALAGCVVAAALIFALSIAANRLVGEQIPAVRNVASILDPTEAANRIRLQQLGAATKEVARTSWHGKGAASFVALNEAPRLPEHESAPVGLIVSFGLGGACLTALFGVRLLQGARNTARLILRQGSGEPSPVAGFVGISLTPFALYGLVAPIFSGTMFGVITFTIIGLQSISESPVTSRSGKP